MGGDGGLLFLCSPSLTPHRGHPEPRSTLVLLPTCFTWPLRPAHDTHECPPQGRRSTPSLTPPHSTRSPARTCLPSPTRGRPCRDTQATSRRPSLPPSGVCGHPLRLPIGRQHGGQPGGFLRDPSRRSHTILESYRKRTQIYKGTNEPEQQRPGEKAPFTNLPPQEVRGRQHEALHCWRLPAVSRSPAPPGAPLSPHPPLTPQKTSSPAKTVASGTEASGTCKPTCSTTVPAARAPAPRPQLPPTRSPRRLTPTSASAPSPSAARAAPAPAPWRSTCAATAVRPQAPSPSPHVQWGARPATGTPAWSSYRTSQCSPGTWPTCAHRNGQLRAGPLPQSRETRGRGGRV